MAVNIPDDNSQGTGVAPVSVVNVVEPYNEPEAPPKVIENYINANRVGVLPAQKLRDGQQIPIPKNK